MQLYVPISTMKSSIVLIGDAGMRKQHYIKEYCLHRRRRYEENNIISLSS